MASSLLLWPLVTRLKPAERQAVCAMMRHAIEGVLHYPNQEARDASGSHECVAVLEQLGKLERFELQNIVSQIQTNWSDEFDDLNEASWEETGSAPAPNPHLPPKSQELLRDWLKLPNITATQCIEIGLLALTQGDPSRDVTTAEIQLLLKEYGAKVDNPAALIQSVAKTREPQILIVGKTGKYLRVKLSPEAARKGREKLFGETGSGPTPDTEPIDNPP